MMIRAWSWIANNISVAFGFGIIQTPSGTSPTATVPNDTLTLTSADGTVVITGNSGTKTVDFSAPAPAAYTIVAISSNTVAVSGRTYECDTSGGPINLTFPAPTAGSNVRVKDVGGVFETNQLTAVRNGSEKMENVAASYVCYANYGAWLWVADGTNWWLQ